MATRGRRPIGAEKMVKLTIHLPRSYVMWAEAAGRGNVSAGVRRIFDIADHATPADEASSGPIGGDAYPRK